MRNFRGAFLEHFWPGWKVEELQDLDVSLNGGTPKSSILIGFSIMFTIQDLGYPYFWKHPFLWR